MRSVLVASALALTAAASPVVELPQLLKRTACQLQPLGAGVVTRPDTASAFAKNPYYASVASAAPSPSGYIASFVGYNASNNADGYLTFTTVQSFDPSICAAKCNSIAGCQSFNIYFERDPTLDPDARLCPNPSSTTNIKCSFWTGQVNLANANNYGQMRVNFQVEIAGSSGYNLNPTPGYLGTPLGNAAINAPLDCNGANTFLQVEVFTGVSTFNPALCAKACSDQNSYAFATGSTNTCQGFNGYLQLSNGVATEQHCTLYSETWNSTYATNTGQIQGANTISIGSSFFYSNITNPGVCVPAAPTVTP